jgi:cell division protease FtsH
VTEAHTRVREVLTEKRDQLEILSATLLEKETLQEEELKALLERPPMHTT